MTSVWGEAKMWGREQGKGRKSSKRPKEIRIARYGSARNWRKKGV